MIRHRITPRGFAAFLRTTRAQRSHLHSTWPNALRTAWKYGPIR